jgi:predicted transcriptional regulator
MPKKDCFQSELPNPAAFRAWLTAALAVLRLSQSAVARDLGLSKNALSGFVSNPERDICLGNAARVHRLLTERAAAAGVALPPVGGVV